MSDDIVPGRAGHPAAVPPLKKREPAFNVPSGLMAILGLLVAVHLVRAYLLTPDQDGFVVFNFAFAPARYTFPLSEQNLAWLWTPVTYSLLHGSFLHLLFNAFWMVAFGAPVLRRIGMLRFTLFWCLSSAAAVAFHSLFHWGDFGVVVGASGAIAGLMGAAMRFVFSGHGGINGPFVHLNPRSTVPQSLSNRSVLVFIGMFFATNLLMGLGLLSGDGAAPVAWEAHIGGFLFGFLLFGLFDPKR